MDATSLSTTASETTAGFPEYVLSKDGYVLSVEGVASSPVGPDRGEVSRAGGIEVFDEGLALLHSVPGGKFPYAVERRGDRLFVAWDEPNAVAVYDVSSLPGLTVLGRYALPRGETATSFVFVGSLLFAVTWEGSLLALDVSTDDVRCIGASSRFAGNGVAVAHLRERLLVGLAGLGGSGDGTLVALAYESPEAR
jgi:hypothetical protein